MLLDECHQWEALECMCKIQLEIKIERQVGRRGVSGKWFVLIVLFICELLANGIPPSAVPANIQTVFAQLTGTAACELPYVDLDWKFRVVLHTVNKTLSGFWLGNADTWHQLFTDGNYRRKIAFQNLVIAWWGTAGLIWYLCRHVCMLKIRHHKNVWSLL